MIGIRGIGGRDRRPLSTIGPTSNPPTFDAPADRSQPRATTRVAVIAAMLTLMAAFVALGAWQLERRAGKLALIERVQERVHATPSDAPTHARWSSVNAADDEYRHVRVAGRFFADRATYVQALTAYGSGYWAIVPFRLPNGDVVLVNRGFVAHADHALAYPPTSDAPVVVTGLLRISEPHGTLLQANDPASDHWYSRDVGAIATARALGPVAPYFIDADAATGEPSSHEPIGGLTVIAFRNDHLSYAVTWFVLAALCGVAVRRLIGTKPRARC